MSLTLKLIISLVIAAAVASAATLAQGEALPDIPMLAACCVAAVASVIAVSLPGRSETATVAAAPSGEKRSATPARRQDYDDSNREFGQVKWFNASKGFGFIIKEDGDEIFVHFRSIRGEGRRGLKDGQRVSFVVADSQKGPQAEDVTPES
jgi:CspA family cold shock protein